jgi:hypothetical protein
MSDVVQDTDLNQDGGDFAAYIAAARERLTAEGNAIREQQAGLQHQLDAINSEFAAIEAYESAKAGKAARPNTTASRTPRARRGSRREACLDLIRQSDGLSRGEIIDRMGLKGDKSGEMSVSNALTALTKGNHVRREGGKYHAASRPPSAEDVHGALREAAE